MTDKTILTAVLCILKDLMKMGNTAMIEAPTMELRQVFTTAAMRHGDCQFAVFEFMEKHGMYPIEAAPPEKIKQAISTHSKN